MKEVDLPFARSVRTSVLLGTGFLRALLRTGLVVAGSIPTSRTEFDLTGSYSNIEFRVGIKISVQSPYF